MDARFLYQFSAGFRRRFVCSSDGGSFAPPDDGKKCPGGSADEVFVALRGVGDFTDEVCDSVHAGDEVFPVTCGFEGFSACVLYGFAVGRVGFYAVHGVLGFLVWSAVRCRFFSGVLCFCFLCHGFVLSCCSR